MLCDGCGVCCLTVSLPPFDVKRDDIAAVPKVLMDGVAEYRNSPRMKMSNPCLWFDLQAGKCRHYEHRPLACREFEPGNPACLKMRKDHRVRDQEDIERQADTSGRKTDHHANA